MKNITTAMCFSCLVAAATVAQGLTYDAANDYWDPTVFRVDVHPVSTVDDLLTTPGCHATSISSYNPESAQTSYRLIEIGRMRFLDGYLKYVINISRPLNDEEYELYKAACFDRYAQSLQQHVDYETYEPPTPAAKLMASAYVMGVGADPWDRQVVLADGFDPGNQRTAETIASEKNFNLLVQPDGNTILGNGFDMCLVDFQEGAADIRENAKALLAVVEYVCGEAHRSFLKTHGVAPKSKAGTLYGEVAVGGFSMGGLVARLALLYGQKERGNVPSARISNVNRYISIDSPHQGAAGFNLDFQRMAEEYVADQFWQLNSSAARQMLYEHISAAPDYSAFHDDFYQFVEDMGDWPTGVERVGIADSHWPKGEALYAEESYTWQMEITYMGESIISEDITFSGHDLEHGAYVDLIGDFLDPAQKYQDVLRTARATIALAWPLGDAVVVAAGSLFEPLLPGITPHLFATWTIAKNTAGTVTAEITRPDILPTFIPISSVFDLDENTPDELRNDGSLDMLQNTWSPFNRLFCIKKRDMHIVFSPELMKRIVCALQGAQCEPALSIKPLTGAGPKW